MGAAGHRMRVKGGSTGCEARSLKAGGIRWKSATKRSVTGVWAEIHCADFGELTQPADKLRLAESLVEKASISRVTSSNAGGTLFELLIPNKLTGVFKGQSCFAGR